MFEKAGGREARFAATGFLKQMVRIMMGTLVAVGRGRLAPAEVGWLLAGGDRRQAPATAPATGLCLERVFYGPAPTTGPDSAPSAPSALPIA